MTLFPVLVDVYHKEHLVTKEEAEKAASDERGWKWKWGKVAAIKDVSSATRIADILDKYGFNDVARHIRGVCTLVCVYKYCTGSLWKGTIILNISCMLYSCISCTLCMCACINHFSEVLVVVIMYFK